MEQRVAAVRRQVADRENLPGVNALLDALALALAGAQEKRRAEAQELQSLSPEDQEDVAEGATINQGQLQDALGFYLSAVASTHGNDFDTLIRPLRRMVKTVVPDSEVVFQPSEEYRASRELIRKLEGWAINSGLDAVHDQLRSLPRVIVVEYPASNEADVLQHAHIAHELAHLILDQSAPGDPNEVRSDALFNRHFENVESDLKRKHGTNVEDPPEAAISAQLRDEDRFRNWLLEFSVDALASHLVGPWFFFALVELAHVDGSWRMRPNWSQYETHPHLAWRLAHLADTTRAYFDVEAAKKTLEADSRLDSAERSTGLDLLSEGLALVDRLKQGLPLISDEEIALERRLIDPALNELHQQANRLVGSARYSPEAFWLDLAPVAQKLEAGIPPAERIDLRSPGRMDEDLPWRPTEEGEVWSPESAWSSPLDWRSIVTGSYLHWLLREHPRPAIATDWAEEPPGFLLQDMRNAFERRGGINAAVRGSVELSELLRLAHELRRDSLPLERPPHALA